MKKILYFALAFVTLALASCTKDNELQEKVDDLSKRVATLEEKVNEMNKVTLPGLQGIVAALQNNLYAKAVNKTPQGIEIIFSNGLEPEELNTVVIRDGIDGSNGEQGIKGDTPVMGVTKIDGVYVWTVDGEVVKDAEGNLVPVLGPLPQLRIFEGKWQVSYDEGANWIDVPELGTSGTAISVVDNETTITIYINGEAHVIQKETPFYMTFEKRTEIGVPVGESYLFPFELNGVKEGDELEVEVLSVSAGWEASVLALTNNGGYLKVTNNDNSNAKVFVYATNGRGKTDIKSLQFEGGELSAVIDAKKVEATGGKILVSVTTNMDYYVSVDNYCDWLTVDPDTKAAHTDVISLSAEENVSGAYRSANVYVTNEQTGEEISKFAVVQWPAAGVPTELYSLYDVEDGTVIDVTGVTCMASSKNSAVFFDGESYLYAIGKLIPAGKVYNVSGTKMTDEYTDIPYLVVTNFTADNTATPAEEGDLQAYQDAWYYDATYTALAGILDKDEDGNYFISAAEGMYEYIIDTPKDDVMIENIELGSYASFVGYLVLGESRFIAISAKQVSFKQNNNWTISHSYLSGEDYPELFTNTVSAPGANYFFYGAAKEEDVEKAGGIEEYSKLAAIGASETFYYYVSNYGWIFSFDDLYEMLVYPGDDDAAESFKEFEPGKYFFFVAGLDENANPTGDYQYLEFEKRDPKVFANYSDYLGKWNFDGSTIKIVEDVNGSSYKIFGFAPTNLKNYSSDLYVKATYNADEGMMQISEQTFGTFQNTNYGECTEGLFGGFVLDGYYRYNYIAYSDTPAIAINAALLDDGSIEFRGGSCEYGDFERFNFRWIITEPGHQNFGQGNNYIYYTFPVSLTKDASVDASYEDFLGTWSMYVDLLETNNTFTVKEKEKGVSYIIENFLTVDGAPVFSDGVADVIAEYDAENNCLTVSEQVLCDVYTDADGTWIDMLTGIFEYNGKTYYGYPFNGGPGVLFSAILQADGNINLSAGSNEFSKFVYTDVTYYAPNDPNASGTYGTLFNFPNTWTKVRAASTAKTSASKHVDKNLNSSNNISKTAKMEVAKDEKAEMSISVKSKASKIGNVEAKRKK